MNEIIKKVFFNFRSQHLKEHILTHSKNNSKNFSCPFEACDSKFGSKNLVYRHVKKVHRKEDQKLDSSNEINDFTTKLPNAENEHNQPEQPQFTKRESIGQLDSVTLLPGMKSDRLLSSGSYRQLKLLIYVF